jgi:hypothetical protein
LEGQLDVSLKKQFKKNCFSISQKKIIKKLSMLKFDKDCKQIVKTFFRAVLTLEKSLQKIQKLFIFL